MVIGDIPVYVSVCVRFRNIVRFRVMIRFTFRIRVLFNKRKVHLTHCVSS